MTPTPAVDLLAPLRAGLDLPRVPQQARSRQKRDALLAAAERLFAAQGYEAVTADSIAAAAGVSTGTFYAYFRNKRQLFLTLYLVCLEGILALGIAAVEWGPDTRATVRALVQRALEHDMLFYGLRRAWAELRPRDPEIAAADAQVNALFYSQILTAAQRAAALGLLWPDVDIDTTCWYITVLLDRAWEGEPPPGTITPAARAARHDALADLIYHALFRA